MYIYVNGSFTGSSTDPVYDEELENRGETQFPVWYNVPAVISPGDSVRVLVKAGGLQAEAVTVAPQAPARGAVQHEYVRGEPGKSDVIAFKVRVDDIPATKNYYSLSFRSINHVYGYRWGGLPDETYTDYTTTELVGMDCSHDVYAKADDHASLCLFTDAGFEDGSAVLDIRAKASAFIPSPTDSLQADNKALVRLSSLSREDYDTELMLMSSLRDLPGLNETVNIFPSNVSGGIGQVFIRTDLDILLDL